MVNCSTFLYNVQLGLTSVGGGVVQLGHPHGLTLLGSAWRCISLGPAVVQLGVGHLFFVQLGLSSHQQSWARPGVQLIDWGLLLLYFLMLIFSYLYC